MKIRVLLGAIGLIYLGVFIFSGVNSLLEKGMAEEPLPVNTSLVGNK